MALKPTFMVVVEASLMKRHAVTKHLLLKLTLLMALPLYGLPAH